MSNIPSIIEIEKRMRPGAYSEKGFLGQLESLEYVVSQDTQTLNMLGVSFEQIADALENILRCVEDRRSKLLMEGNYLEYSKREGERENRIPNLYHSEHIPRFSLDSLPDIDVGYLVGDKLQIFIMQYRGLQECPWGCEYEKWSSFDFLVLNRQTSKYITGPGLVVHLIRKHHFFEGFESPYRVNPAEVIRVLGLLL
jgi:hypothetical protein